MSGNKRQRELARAKYERQQARRATRGSRRQRNQRIVAVLVVVALVVAIVLLALDNRDDARLGYVFGDAEAPTWTVIVAAAAIGAIAGWLMRHRPGRSG